MIRIFMDGDLVLGESGDHALGVLVGRQVIVENEGHRASLIEARAELHFAGKVELHTSNGGMTVDRATVRDENGDVAVDLVNVMEPNHMLWALARFSETAHDRMVGLTLDEFPGVDAALRRYYESNHHLPSPFLADRWAKENPDASD